MQFKAHYVPKHALFPDYWRTVWADDVNHAKTLAKRYTRKGYMLCLVISI